MRITKSAERPDNRRVKYGVYGMMEWYAMIPAGRSTLRVHFTGGTVTGYGVTPATFVTDSGAVKHLIEESYWFRKGKIVKLGEESA